MLSFGTQQDEDSKGTHGGRNTSEMDPEGSGSRCIGTPERARFAALLTSSPWPTSGICPMSPASCPPSTTSGKLPMNDAARRFVQQARASRQKLGVIQLPGGSVQAKLLSESGAKVLVVLFHGAVDKDRRTPPVYQSCPPVPFPCHQLSISDPSIEREGTQSVCWYVGHEGFNLQEELPPFLKSLKASLEVERVVFVGMSAGGFAALFYSWHLPESVALVGVPQVSILHYNRRHVQNYLSSCWPSLSAPEQLQSHRVTDVSNLYAQKVPNAVVYLQSTGDRHHLTKHLARFLPAISRVPQARFHFNMDYWGTSGHSGSVSQKTLAIWLRVVATSPSIDNDELLENYYDIRSAAAPEATDGTGRGTEPAADHSDMLRLADRLREYHLRSTEGS